MELRLDGLWKEALETFPELKRSVPAAVNKALLQEAQDLRKRMVEQFRKQAPVSGTWAPLSPFTLRARRVQGFGGRKILIRTGDLRNSIQIEVIGPGLVFVGVNRTALTKGGAGGQRQASNKKKAIKFRAVSPSSASGKRMALVNLGLIHEFGASFTITVTRRMQRYLFGVLLKGVARAGKDGKAKGGRDLGGRFVKKGAAVGGGGSGRFKVGAKLTIRIPARPFVGPAINAMTPAQYEQSIAVKIAVILKGKLGKP